MMAIVIAGIAKGAERRPLLFLLFCRFLDKNSAKLDLA